MTEREHWEALIAAERDLWRWGYRAVAGIDEVGRGALAGPVAAGAVVLREDAYIAGLDDSKRLTGAVRRGLVPTIKDHAVATAVGFASPSEVDRDGIVAACHLAMRRAVLALAVRPDHLVLDATLLPGIDVPQWSLIRGDSQVAAVSAASVIAKERRDALMRHWALRFPDYGWQTNVGYGTTAHWAGLRQYGPCPLHRRSFVDHYLTPGDKPA